MVTHRTQRAEAGWIKEFEGKDAFFLHDDNPLRPHPKLTSGLCSYGFFNGEIILEDPVLLDQVAVGLVSCLERAGMNLNEIDRVVGPAMGAITLANDIARHIVHDHPKRTLRAYVEKATKVVIKRNNHSMEVDHTELQHGDYIADLPIKDMVFKKTKIAKGERVLMVEDALTTGGSVELTARAITDAGGIVLPYIVVIMNRSGLTEVGGRKIIALINKHMPTWKPEECPLCKKGSKAMPAKANWQLLNATY